MIHNSSSDPVLIKKISLKIWSLRDEIESRIQEKIDAGEMEQDKFEEKIAELQREYSKKTALPDNVLQLKSTEDLANADGEDEMARAMAEAMNSEEKEENESEDSDDAPKEETTKATDTNIVEMKSAPGEDNLVTIGIVPPQNLPVEKVSNGKTILSEISMDKMFFFANKAFTEGQSIVIQFCIPKTFIVNADVMYCRPFNIKSRIISPNNYTHRMLVKFNFLKEGERALLREFIKSIEPDVTKVVKKQSNEESDDNESDFNELDDLGL